MSDAKPIWIKDPLAILADGAERGIVVEDGRIVELVPAGGERLRRRIVAAFEAGEHVVLPGLINTHHHFYQTLTRALPAAIDRELFPWLQALYPVWARLTPEALELGVTVAMAELLLSGCTTTTDHHYVFPAGLEDAVDIEVAVAKRLGIRVLLTRGSMNLSQRDGGLPPDSVVQDEDTILADSERLVEAITSAAPDAMVQIALAPCSPFSVTTSLMRATADARRASSTCGCTPISPRPRTRTGSARRSMAAVRSTISRNAAGSNARTWLAHGIIFNAEEMTRLGKAGTAISHCACIEPDAGVRLLPGLRDGGGRRRRSASASTARPRTTHPT